MILYFYFAMKTAATAAIVLVMRLSVGNTEAIVIVSPFVSLPFDITAVVALATVVF
jgi:hypothetical protein